VKRYRVVYSDDAEDDLHAIGLYLAAEASPAIAERFVEALIARCEKLATYPNRGAQRHDSAAGLRTISNKKSVLIAYRVGEEVVTVVGFLYRGRDVAAVLRERQG
jgi:plasmid stabilization system protein ParE